MATRLSEELLREADVTAAETLVALTNNDQANILTSVLAKQLGCQRSLCLINGPGYANMVRSFGIDAQVNPRVVTVSRILQYVRRGRIRAVHEIHDGAGEIIEAEALETTPVVGHPIKQPRTLRRCPLRCHPASGQDSYNPPVTPSCMPRDRVIIYLAATTIFVRSSNSSASVLTIFDKRRARRQPHND